MAATGAPASMPSAEVRAALAPLLRRPGSSAVLTDFDGTLAPIVEDPALARPLDGTSELLASLARRFGVVAVVSGRPVSFLVDRLAAVRPTGPTGGPSGGGVTVPRPGSPGGPSTAVRLVGLYGLEWSTLDGAVSFAPGAEVWRPVVADVAGRLQSAAPPGVLVEAKGLAVTVHWRRAPEAAAWAAAEVAVQAGRTGLHVQPGRMAADLRPPLSVDKGSVTRRLAGGCTAACYLGDDLGDLPAFSALDRLASEEGLTTVSVAAVDDVSPTEVAAAADVTVRGPRGASGLLRWLADATLPDEAGVRRPP